MNVQICDTERNPDQTLPQPQARIHTRTTDERLTASLPAFFTTVIAIGTLGSSITFNLILQDIRDPPPHAIFDKSTCQTFLAISYHLFINALGVAAGLFAYLHHDNPPGGIPSQGYLWFSSISPGILVSLLLAAFIFVSLVVMAYVFAVGVSAVATTSCGGVLLLFAWIKRPFMIPHRYLRQAH